MNQSIVEQIMTLKNQSVEELKAKYEEVFKGEKPTSNNKPFLWRQIAYRLQELEYGGLSVNTQSRINELIDQYDPVNNKMLRPQNAPGKTKTNGRDTRLPIPGAIIRKEYKGQILEVKVLEKGFEFEGQAYKTLSAVAKKVTGDHWNGYLFFKP
ncbi:MAG: DUF2924 domain-containing protein [Candidatus Omnitrophica bacterium]|nr:DUF2924 domain-containing protein [Candidatus Omnitrophota bacterium]